MEKRVWSFKEISKMVMLKMGSAKMLSKYVMEQEKRAVQKTLKRILKKGHGGGNWRRLIIQELNKN